MHIIIGLQSLEFGMLGCVVTSVGVCVYIEKERK